MTRRYSSSGSLVIIDGEPFDAGRDDTIALPLTAGGVNILASAVTAVTATLRTRPYTGLGSVINGRLGQNVRGLNGGVVTDGLFTLALGGATDLVAVGALSMQARELTVMVTHGTPSKALPFVVRFLVRPHADVA